MSDPRRISLAAIRTDGWFERIGATINSFQTLCEVIGPRFFAFAMIAGARITSLTVDRRAPEKTQIDFIVGDDSSELGPVRESLSLGEFRARLVAELTQEDPLAPAPERESDVEALQQHIGIRYLLLAPLFGYGLRQLVIDEQGSQVEVLTQGEELLLPLPLFRANLRALVLQEWERSAREQDSGTIDLAQVELAAEAAAAEEHLRVIELLGAWPLPLASFFRTPEGQMLSGEARAQIARGLALLGSACAHFEDYAKAEEILRLAIQYAGEGGAQADAYLRLGLAFLAHQRPGEAIGALRRAAVLGAQPEKVWPALGRAFLFRERYVAACAAVEAGIQAGVPAEQLEDIRAQAGQRLGRSYEIWRQFVLESASNQLASTSETVPPSAPSFREPPVFGSSVLPNCTD